MQIKITRSDRRAKTVSARLVGETLEVSAPEHLSDAELQPIIEKLAARLERRSKRRELDDADLQQIAQRLNRSYFNGSLAWNSISWSTQQNRRYGSCTPADRTIRISHRLAEMPPFVLEYVVMHELAHLLEANHGPRFWKLVNRYPRTERARGYLMAVGMEELEGDGGEVEG
jgi:predicted metal-dependent hydrolase